MSIMFNIVTFTLVLVSINLVCSTSIEQQVNIIHVEDDDDIYQLQLDSSSSNPPMAAESDNGPERPPSKHVYPIIFITALMTISVVSLAIYVACYHKFATLAEEAPQPVDLEVETEPTKKYTSTGFNTSDRCERVVDVPGQSSVETTAVIVNQ